MNELAAMDSRIGTTLWIWLGVCALLADGIPSRFRAEASKALTR